MSANEKVYPMDTLLQSFTAAEKAAKAKWWSKKTDASTRIAQQPRAGHEEGEMLHLVQCVFLSPATLAPKKVIFCGIDEDNSSQVCASAGPVLAEQTGADVCLVDANIRHGRLSKLFNIDQVRPIRASLTPMREQCAYVSKNLFVAGTGVLQGCDGALAPAKEVRERLTALSRTFEYLLIDTPAVNTSSETGVIGQVAGYAVLVLEANSTRRSEAKRAKDRLKMADISILGTVLDKGSR